MAEFPAFPLWTDAYLGDTRHLSLEEHGAYLQLMMIAWRSDDCSLPDDDKRIAQMLGITGAKWAGLKPIVMAFWTIEGGRWSQKRLAKERKFVSEKREKNAQAARARWNGQATENKQDGSCERISKRTSKRTSERNAPIPNRTSKDVLTRARTIPDDWQPEPFTDGSEAARIIATWTTDALTGQGERFRDYHRAKGSKFVDWQAAWGTWVRNSVGFASARPQQPIRPDDPQAFLRYKLEQRQREAEWAAAGASR